ncbi:MAG: polysaccharide ABC transporter ATP-binding protein [Acidobacteriota bacterium]
MANASVVFDGVWKKFRRGERHDSLRDLATSSVKGLFTRQRKTELSDQEFWAVENVSFEVKPGEAFGIIGPNGAGKSTTLKLLTRILRPTRGRCEVRGRAGALIEVAAGFHPDLTGRENVYLQGTIMGMKRQEIATRLEEIVEFSGVRAFIDTPVKRYSSGMNARLGFSIAAHLDPDVLIIDEVLSVGDMLFQRKCLQRMLDYRARGTAIVFVSHHLASVVQLCQSAILLRNQTVMIGDATAVVHHYLDQTSSGQITAEKDAKVTLRATLSHVDGRTVDECRPGETLVLDTWITALEDVGSHIVPAFLCNRMEDDLVIYDVNFSGAEEGWGGLRAGETMKMTFRFSCHLTRGSYNVGMNLYDPHTSSFVVKAPRLANIKVFEDRTYAGIADLAARMVLARPESERQAEDLSHAGH